MDRVPVAVAVSVRSSAVALALVIAACTGNQKRATPPMPSDWVTDSQAILSPFTRKALDERLRFYEQQTGHQVIVWISGSTNGEPHADYAIRAANAWGVGRTGKDDGVVLFVFVRDDMRWIWVGYGLEKAIQDKEASRICREVIAPKVRRGEVDGGIKDGVDAILWAIDSWEKR